MLGEHQMLINHSIPICISRECLAKVQTEKKKNLCTILVQKYSSAAENSTVRNLWSCPLHSFRQITQYYLKKKKHSPNFHLEWATRAKLPKSLDQSNGAFQVQENLLSDAPVLKYTAEEPGLAKNHNDFLFYTPECYSFAFYEPLTAW